MTFDFQKDFETVVIRKWKGHWGDGCTLPPFDVPAGGFVLTFHRGTNDAYHAEHYKTIAEIRMKYDYKYYWLERSPEDAPDIILIGI